MSGSSEEITTAVGVYVETSSAWLGPDKAAICTSGKTSFITSVYTICVSASIPFEHKTNTWFLFA